ncbi:MAG: response regulator [Bacteroidota bacterium]
MPQIYHDQGNPLSEDSAFSVLVVDDEPLVRWSLENSLRKAGYQVTTAQSAEQAIEELRVSHFDLIITDMRLPRQDGFTVAAVARKYFPQSPVMMITAYGDEVARSKAGEQGIVYFVDKPFDLAKMVSMVSEILIRPGKNNRCRESK